VRPHHAQVVHAQSKEDLGKQNIESFDIFFRTGTTCAAIFSSGAVAAFDWWISGAHLPSKTHLGCI
jgi:hypothetical protein